MSQICWWRIAGSNRWPPDCKSGALPAELIPRISLCWWAEEDSNFRPHPYQGCALTTWATGPSIYLETLKEEKWGRSHYRFFLKSKKILTSFRKEVIQPQVPLRLPCYDFTPVADRTVVKGISFALRCNQLPWCDGRCVQDPGTYSPRRADPRLLAIPASCTRVTEYNPNWDTF